MSRSKKNNIGARRMEGAIMRASMAAQPQPPRYISNAFVSKTFRFTCTSAGFYTITPCKLGALVVIGTAVNSAATQLFDAVKIRKVCIWAGQNPSGTGSPVTVSCSWSGSIAGIMGDQKVDSDTSIGADRVAYISSKPPKNSQAAQWQSTDTAGIGTNTIFQLNLPLGAVIDLHLNLRCTFTTRASANTITLAAVVVSQLYYLALDNTAGTTGSQSNSLKPDSTLITTS